MQSQTNAAYELSPQQKLLFNRNLERTTSGIAVPLQGAEPEKVKHVTQQLLERHEILRTTFQRRTGMKFPFQVVGEECEISWSETDLSSLAERRQREEVSVLLGDRSVINIESGPVFSCTLVKLSAARYVLVMTFSSLCVDNSSLDTLLQEFMSLHSKARLTEDVLQYADFSEWQNEQLKSSDEESLKTAQLWKQAQAEAIPGLTLPFQKKHGNGAAQRDSVSLGWDSNRTEDFLLTCWEAFLWRVTGQQEFVLGYQSSGRNHEEFNSGIGIYTTPLPLRCSFEQELGLRELIERNAKIRINSLQYADYFPADSLAENVQIGFSFSTSAADNQAANEYARLTPPPPFRLQLSCAGNLEIQFDGACFHADYVQELANSFQHFLQTAESNPAALVSEIPITTPDQKQKVVVEFNQTAARCPSDRCIHQMFEEQAASHPERLALRFGEGALRFAELNQQANRLANTLLKNRVGPNVPVALCVERSAEMIVGLLGILKAGGCYVPLIPENPKPRLAHQLSETGAPVIVTEERHLNRLPEFEGKIICLDRDRDMLAKADDQNPSTKVSPDDLVYVIYTSGSTGVPKGVAVRHRNLVNYSHFICRRLELEKHSAGLNFATVSTIGADLGNTCIFPSLISGGCLHVVGYEMAMSPALFADYASRHPIDVLKITPSHLSTLLDGSAPALPRKYLVLGGEAARWELIDRVRKAGSCAIFNHYGPTEATVGCCTFAVDNTDVSAWEPSTAPIGRPIANDQVYIVDRHLNPLPVGVAGELCVAGAGLAQVYLNQPQQTAERFVRNPFSEDADARMYRTGDLARFLPDGNIEFLGRIDQQVKIRGFRVEPAEIEAALRRHPSVKQAAVVPFDDKTGKKRLAAYVVGACRPEELKTLLNRELPDYMVPAAILTVESLPLTANGKLDLRALPSPEQTVKQREFIAPRNEDENKLTEIWKSVLKLEQVGVTDNFFELGGHSLLATQIISRIRNTFRVQMPLHAFLQNPTIAALAQQIGQCPAIESEQEEMARLLQELDGISEEEAERLLAAELEKDKS